MTLLLSLFAFSLSYVMTASIRKRARFDQPNARSSHQIPTPRGGGLAFVLCFMTAIGLGYLYDLMSTRLCLTFWVAGGGIALLGGLDDQYGLAAGVRFFVQLLLSLLAVWGLEISDPIYMVFAVLYLTWMTNLFNFMDGINGLAAMEAIFVAAGMLLLADPQLNLILAALAAALMGFVLWNFPKAYIFMGDVGSGFLGMVLGIASLVLAKTQASFFAGNLILMGIFVTDATFTLFMRALRGERFWEAHCTHVYQRLARRLGSHIPVTLGLMLINVCWLLPLAILTAWGHCSPGLGLTLAYLPLLYGALGEHLRNA